MCVPLRAWLCVAFWLAVLSPCLCPGRSVSRMSVSLNKGCLAFRSYRVLIVFRPISFCFVSSRALTRGKVLLEEVLVIGTIVRLREGISYCRLACYSLGLFSDGRSLRLLFVFLAYFYSMSFFAYRNYLKLLEELGL